MSEEKRKVLDMLAAGKITADEAERLLSAMDKPATTTTEESSSNKKKPRFLHVHVNPGPDHPSGKESVNIKIPLALLRAGIKLTSLVPDKAKGSISTSLTEKGIDIDLEKLDSKQLEGLLESLTEMSIDVDSDDGEKVKIYCA